MSPERRPSKISRNTKALQAVEVYQEISERGEIPKDLIISSEPILNKVGVKPKTLDQLLFFVKLREIDPLAYNVPYYKQFYFSTRPLKEGSAFLPEPRKTDYERIHQDLKMLSKKLMQLDIAGHQLKPRINPKEYRLFIILARAYPNSVSSLDIVQGVWKHNIHEESDFGKNKGHENLKWNLVSRLRRIVTRESGGKFGIIDGRSVGGVNRGFADFSLAKIRG